MRRFQAKDANGEWEEREGFKEAKAKEAKEAIASKEPKQTKQTGTGAASGSKRKENQTADGTQPKRAKDAKDAKDAATDEPNTKDVEDVEGRSSSSSKRKGGDPTVVNPSGEKRQRESPRKRVQTATSKKESQALTKGGKGGPVKPAVGMKVTVAMQVATRKEKGKQREKQIEKFKGKISSLDTIGRKQMMRIEWDNGDKPMSFALNDPAVEVHKSMAREMVGKGEQAGESTSATGKTLGAGRRSSRVRTSTAR
jgi:hypothetical protein